MPKHEPVRIFDGSARPHEPFWGLRNAAEAGGGEPEIEFYGYISEYSWWEDDITPAKFKEDLYRLGAGGPVTVRINSGGGDVVAASVLRSLLVDYPGRVTMRVDGLCASAATYVAMAGDVVRMQDTAFWMIHDPAALALGTIDELKGVLRMLETVKAGIIDAYAGKTKLGPEKLSKMMTAETWLTAHEAREMGFVDEVIGGQKPAKNAAQTSLAWPVNLAIVNALRNYVNVPEALKAMLCPAQTVDGGDDPKVNLATERLRAEVKLFV